MTAHCLVKKNKKADDRHRSVNYYTRYKVKNIIFIELLRFITCPVCKAYTCHAYQFINWGTENYC